MTAVMLLCMVWHVYTLLSVFKVAIKDAYTEQEQLSKLDPALRHNAPSTYLAGSDLSTWQ